MNGELEQRIRDRAYALWVDAGKPDGDEERHWHAAQKELEGGSAIEPSTPYGEAGGQAPPTKTSKGPEPSTPYVKD